MFLTDARDLLADTLSPLPVERFLGFLTGAEVELIEGGDSRHRTDLLGAAPTDLLLRNFGHLAAILTYHSAEPLGAPPIVGSASSEAEFRERIECFHDRGYSVRFPDLRPLSKDLDRVARALEMVLHQPVSASAFWSRGRLRAPVHFDEHDIIAIQLRGEKTWHVSGGLSPFCVDWPGIPEALPRLNTPKTMMLRPGDFLYLPRGLPHTVEAEGESLHLALGFTPLTVRSALIAVIDQMAESDRRMRNTLMGHLSGLSAATVKRDLLPHIVGAANYLQTACLSVPFVEAALGRRSARAIGALRELAAPFSFGAINIDTSLRPANLAFCHLTSNSGMIDFSYPGGHLYIHRGALDALLFIVNAKHFCIRDIPGALGDDAKLALAEKLLSVGYLQILPAAIG